MRSAPKHPYVRETLFWIAAALAAVSIVALDRAVFFVYFPRWALAIPIVLFLFPSRVNSTYWARAATCVGLIALLYAVAPVRWNLLKSFYLDCESLEPGIDFADALARMSTYSSNTPGWMERAAMNGVRESPSERSARVVLVPSPDDSADWCVLYPERGQLARVEIHPD